MGLEGRSDGILVSEESKQKSMKEIKRKVSGK